MPSYIDLRSDTSTKPCPAMIQAMATAEVGDDAYGEDRNVATLEEYCIDYFGKPAALFMPSGTMSNQVAIRSLTQPGDEVLCDVSYHINFFESAQSADLGKVVLHPIHSDDGVLTAKDLQKATDLKARWNNSYAAPRLVWLENSISTHGGSIYPLSSLKDVRTWCKNANIPLFMDGARLFNASVATNTHCARYADLCDALTVCFSKGLGAPFGSMLIGSKEFIERAQRFRKWFGGGLHQSGYMAAAALYALKHNIARLSEDHENAKLLARTLRENNQLQVNKVDTNMVVFSVKNLNVTGQEFVHMAAKENVHLLAWRGDEIRAAASSNVNRGNIVEAGHRLLKLAKQTSAKTIELSKAPERGGIQSIAAFVAQTAFQKNPF